MVHDAPQRLRLRRTARSCVTMPCSPQLPNQCTDGSVLQLFRPQSKALSSLFLVDSSALSRLESEPVGYIGAWHAVYERGCQEKPPIFYRRAALSSCTWLQMVRLIYDHQCRGPARIPSDNSLPRVASLLLLPISPGPPPIKSLQLMEISHFTTIFPLFLPAPVLFCPRPVPSASVHALKTPISPSHRV